jgi:hypothetical protein
MNEEETLAALWEIAQEVATQDSTGNDAYASQYCPFCIGCEYRMEPFKHEDDCIVLKARALVAQSDPQSH